MKNYFWLDCNNVLDIVYESDGSLPIIIHIKIGLHLLLCPHCSMQITNLRHLEKIMKTDFFPPAPLLEEPIMERLYAEAIIEEEYNAPAGFSFRGWIIIGFFMLLSLSSSFFGVNFIEIANKEGLSFLLPVGITIGIVVTCYGALFISSHLKELSNRFGLR